MIKNETLKNLIKLTSNILVYVISILLLLTVWLNNNMISTCCITMSIITLVMTIISVDDIKSFYKEINVFYYVVLIVIAFSRLLNSDPLFYIGIGLFVMVILVYVLFSFVLKEKNAINKNSNKNKGNKNGKK